MRWTLALLICAVLYPVWSSPSKADERPLRRIQLAFGESFGGMGVVPGAEPFLFTVSSLETPEHQLVHRSRLWDFRTGEIFGSFDVVSPNDQNQRPTFHAAVGQTQPVAVFGGWDQMLYIVDTREMKEIGRVRAHEHYGIRSLALSTDDRFAVTGGEDFSVRVFDVRTHELLELYESDDGMVEYVGFVMQNRIVVSTQVDQIKLWRRSDGRLIRQIQAPARIQTVAVSKDGNFIAVGSGESEKPFVWIYNAETLSLEGQFDFLDDVHPDFPNGPLSLAWSNSNCCVVAGGTYSAKIYNFITDTVVKKIPEGTLFNVSFSRDDKSVFLQDPYAMTQWLSGLE